MFDVIEKINRRLPFAFFLLVFGLALRNLGKTVQLLTFMFLDDYNLETMYTGQHIRSTATKEIGKGNETVAQYPVVALELSLQENDGGDEFAGNNNSVKFDARAMDGIDSAHMARDGAWIKRLHDKLKCDEKPPKIDGEYTYARIPTKETWYVSREGILWVISLSKNFPLTTAVLSSLLYGSGTSYFRPTMPQSIRITLC
jgi:hypothetical protein